MAAFKQFMSFRCQCDVEIHQMCHKAFRKRQPLLIGGSSVFTQRAENQGTIESKVYVICLV